MKEHTTKASVMAFIVYPVLGLAYVIYSLLRDQSVHFMGFNLLLEEGPDYLRASLNFEWYFLLTFLGVFSITWFIDYAYKRLTLDTHQD